MYAYIKGELAEINTDHIVIEAGGIGYQVFISLQTFDYLPSVGENLKIYTYLYLREDAMILYGFLTKDDLELFKLLISVSGIGPKGGLAILSTLEADDLRFAILSGDAKAISKAPGVGGKTAQRVILELKDKLSLEDAFEAKKQWGFFSKKDMKFHSFVLCEECYDRITAQFVIPPDVSEVTEL